MRQTKGPEFIRFFKPILEVLLELGGSGTASEVVDRSLEVGKFRRQSRKLSTRMVFQG